MTSRLRNIVIVLIGLSAIFGFSCLQNLVHDVRICLWSNFKVSLFRLLQAGTISILLLWGANKFIAWIKSHMEQVKMHPSNRALITNTITILVYAVGILIVLRMLNIDLTAFAFLSGGLAIGVGFGMQKIASNFISGIIILFEKSVEVGDLLQIDENTRGFLRDTGAIYTLIQALDGRNILIPNESLITNRVVSLTHKGKKGRLMIDLGVSYNSDIHRVKEILLECVQNHPAVVDHERTTCILTKFGEHSIDFSLRFWIQDITKGALITKSDIMFDIWDQFKKHGIVIPFPQREIKIISQDKEIS